MFNIFKKKDKIQSNNLIIQWSDYCKDLGLTQGQILGLAYFNSAIPTVLSVVNQNEEILSPLSKVVKDIGKVSSSEANALYLYREFFFNAKARDSSILPLELENISSNFFDNGNRYLKFIDPVRGMLMNSKLTILLVQETGNILSDYKVGLEKAFELGHFHSNFFLNSSNGSLNYSKIIITSNTLPQYLASAIDIIPRPNSVSLNKDLWLFSKILHYVLNDVVQDSEFKEWIWYFHNSIFYENKPGSTNIKGEWSLKDSKFEIKMIEKIMATLPAYYKLNKKIGAQQRDLNPKIVNWEDFYPLLNNKMIEKYKIQSPTTQFINLGELCNYFAFKFIGAVETIFEHLEF
jgi:hypothetical protein